MNYQMYTPEGDTCVADAVQRLIEDGLTGLFPRTNLLAQIQALQTAISKAGHSEVYDTEPEWAITDEVNEKLCGPMGWQPISRDEF